MPPMGSALVPSILTLGLGFAADFIVPGAANATTEARVHFATEFRPANQNTSQVRVRITIAPTGEATPPELVNLDVPSRQILS